MASSRFRFSSKLNQATLLDSDLDFMFLAQPGKSGNRTVIEVRNLKKTYGEKNAVDDISFTVNEGEIFGLLGPNGAGKSTTAEIVEGLRPADSGSISILGMDVQKNAEEIKQRIGIQLQAPSLLPLLSVEEILDLFASVYRHSIPVEKLLDMVALKESRKVLVKNLSGGQQQRLSVAIALVNDPEIAFLDEPSTGLDPQARRGLWTVIENMRSQGKSVFLTTHFMEEAERLCDRIAIMDSGKIIALGAPDELIDTYFKESAIEFEPENPIPQEVLQNFAAATNVAIDGTVVAVYSSDITATLSSIMQYAEYRGIKRELKNLHVRQASLEDVFLKLTGRRIRK